MIWKLAGSQIATSGVKIITVLMVVRLSLIKQLKLQSCEANNTVMILKCNVSKSMLLNNYFVMLICLNQNKEFSFGVKELHKISYRIKYEVLKMDVDY